MLGVGPSNSHPRRRVAIGIAALFVVLGAGTTGYWLLGLPPLEALYQTVTTVSTVGFRELFRLDPATEIFTIVLVLAGVGTVLYAFGELLEVLIEGTLTDLVGRRRMDRQLEQMEGHVIVCGWGRIGRAVAEHLEAAGRNLVVVDIDGSRLEGTPHPHVVGDATEDAVLRRAGIARASGLAAVTANDATNVYLALSGRSLSPDLFIVARARVADSEPKLLRAGANRVINPQAIGGARAAAFLLQPHVAEFVDVVTHGRDMEFRLAEFAVSPTAAFVRSTLRDAHIRDRTGALVLAVRHAEGRFTTNPSPDSTLEPGQILIAIGTDEQLRSLGQLAAPTSGH
ncbi:MAG: potassium channel protein [Actinomycetota bacterium]|jgi:voltage-gated potassium channel|nr:potassium channel protein [Actinomycetota bacterium]